MMKPNLLYAFLCRCRLYDAMVEAIASNDGYDNARGASHPGVIGPKVSPVPLSIVDKSWPA